MVRSRQHPTRSGRPVALPPGSGIAAVVAGSALLWLIVIGASRLL